MAFTIAVAGKGGSGKTTIASLIIRSITASRRGPLLAVDADPNFNLASLLGLEVSSTVADIREDMVEKRLSISPGQSKERVIELLIEESLVEAHKFDLLTMGRPEGPGCYCYANHLLRSYLDRIAKRYPFVVLDNEAGMEHLSRRTTNDIDALILVAEPTPVSLRAVERISSLSLALPVTIRRRFLLLNRAGEEIDSAVREMIDRMNLEIFATVPYDRSVEEIVSNEEPVFSLPDDSPAYRVVRHKVGEFLEGAGLKAVTETDSTK